MASTVGEIEFIAVTDLHEISETADQHLVALSSLGALLHLMKARWAKHLVRNGGPEKLTERRIGCSYIRPRSLWPTYLVFYPITDGVLAKISSTWSVQVVSDPSMLRV